MRVLVVHNRYRSAIPSGENRVVDQECALLIEGGHDVIRHEVSSDSIAQESLVRRATLPARVVWSGAARRALADLIRAERPDVVHLHNTFPLLSPSVAAACRDAGVPAVMTLHNFRMVCANGLLMRDGVPCHSCVGRAPMPAIRHGCYRDSRIATVPIAASIALQRVLKTFPTSVTTFFAPSRFVADLMIQAGLPAEKMIVKPHVVPRPTVHRAGAGEDFIFIGRLAPEKGIDLLLAAWAAGSWARSLVIAGDGPMRREVEDAARTLGGITYLGQLSPEACARLRTRARALVMPSRFYETFGLSAVEALAAGVPAIVPAHGALNDLGPDAGCVPIEPGSVSSLIEAMRALDDDDELSVRLGQRGIATYEETFAPEAGLERLIAGYEGAMACR